VLKGLCSPASVAREHSRDFRDTQKRCRMASKGRCRRCWSWQLPRSLHGQRALKLGRWSQTWSQTHKLGHKLTWIPA
jgi:hypothetical protein